MKREFRAGSVVKLKTGGANMIVVKYEQFPAESKLSENGNFHPHSDGLVSVTWFEQGRWKTGKFEPELLALVD